MGKTKLIEIKERVKTSYLNFYTLIYENRLGHRKEYEMVSKQQITKKEELAGRTNGVSMVVYYKNKLLFLKEFRMAVNQYIYNLPAGTLEDGEEIEDCVRRELFEETGLLVKKMIDVLPAAYGAIDVSNAKAALVFLEAEGEISTEHLTEDEELIPETFTRNELKKMLQSESFSGRAQMAAWYFIHSRIEG
ncbi:MAG: NUDIX hydrolase [Lachnospiraceae bacterium]|nr:NUDIX hydrolase [Lachnospiraceae bacterium]